MNLELTTAARFAPSLLEAIAVQFLEPAFVRSVQLTPESVEV